MGYLTVQKTAELWGITVRQVQNLCRNVHQSASYELPKGGIQSPRVGMLVHTVLAGRSVCGLTMRPSV
jgi:hypothetical protein